MFGTHKLDVDIDKLTKDQFQVPLHGIFHALLVSSMACQASDRAAIFVRAWGKQHDKIIHAVTIDDVFQLIEEIEEKDVGFLDIPISDMLQQLPDNARLTVTLGLGDMKGAVIGTIKHALGHIVSVTPEMALAAHVYELAGAVMLQHLVDQTIAGISKELGKPAPQEALWPKVHEYVQESLNKIARGSGTPRRLEIAIERCVALSDVIGESIKLHDALHEELGAKRVKDQEKAMKDTSVEESRPEPTATQRFADSQAGQDVLLDRPKDEDGNPQIQA